MTRCGCCIPSHRSLPKRCGLRLPHDGATIITATWPDHLEVSVDRERRAGFRSAHGGTVDRVRNERAEIGLPPARAPVGRRPGKHSRRHLEAIALPTRRPTAGAALQVDGSLADGTRRIAVAGTQRSACSIAIERRRCVCAARSSAARRSWATTPSSSKAAPDVVAKEREKLDGYRAELARVEAALRAKGSRHDDSSACGARPRRQRRDRTASISRLAHQILEPEDAQDGSCCSASVAAARRSRDGSRARSNVSADARRRWVSQHQSLSRRSREPRDARIADSCGRFGPRRGRR